MTAILILATSCSKDEAVTPEITAPSSAENFFAKSMDFDSDGGTKVISFTTNVEWTLTVTKAQGGSTSWCTVLQSQGGAGTFSIPVTVQKNYSEEERNVVIVLKAGDASKNVIVNQKQQDALTVTANRHEMGPEGGTIEIQLRSNLECKATIGEDCKDWIVPATGSRAMVSSRLYFDIAKSEEYGKREGTITITAGNLAETVKVYQIGSAIFVLSQNEYTLGCEGGTISVDISSNYEFGVEMPDVDWVRNATESRAVSSHTLRYDILENKTYNCRDAIIIFKDNNSSQRDTVRISQDRAYPPETLPEGVEAVDLGLSSGILWASMNVGATSPTSVGTYVAWGETEGATYINGLWEGKLDFTEENYKYYSHKTELVDNDGFTESHTYSGYTKYVLEEKYGFKGYVDGKKQLDGEDDIATVKWGGKWRMPTAYEMQELMQECTSTYGYLDGVKGYKVTGPNGNWIFFPGSGYCSGNRSEIIGNLGEELNYNNGYVRKYKPNITASNAMFWTSTVLSYQPYCYWWETGGANKQPRYYGMPVRPVRSR